MTSARSRTPVIAASAATLVLVAGAGGYGLARLTAQPMAAAPTNADARKPLYWYDPMVPGQHFDKPGKSPFMDMQLLPKYADEKGAEDGAVRIDAGAAQNLGLRTVQVREGRLPGGLSVPGTVEFNQRDVAVVQARAGGFVQKVNARAPGDVIDAGAPLADILVPDWGGAQAEYLAVRRSGDPALISAARQRLKLLGMSEGLVQAVERDGRPRTIITIPTPSGGVITRLDVRAGMTVAMGQTLAEINGVGRVWVTAAVPEALAGKLRSGPSAGVTFTAWPGERFDGRVQAILPQVQGDSRTVQARIELANPQGRLRPGLFATVTFAAADKSALLIPSEAVIRTGRRAVVMLASGNGRYQAVEVRTGEEAGGQTEILAGLNAGQSVVASGQFLVDSEASLSGLQVRPLPAQPAMSPMPSMAMPPTSKVAPTSPLLPSAEGRIEMIDKDGVTISHGPVPAIGWPAMTMTFSADARQLQGLKAGDQVTFAFEQTARGATVRRIAKMETAR